MSDNLATAIERLARVLERLEQKLDAQLPETGTKQDAAALLGISIKSLDRLMPQFIEGSHYWRQGKRLIFDLVLLRDWQRNKDNPHLHQRAIEQRRRELLSQKKRS